MMKNAALVFVSLTFLTISVLGQGGPGGPGPGGPPPLQPLTPPPAPAGNPITTAKTNLGKVLFWDEQLSSTRTISCGTCHQPATGGADPRSRIGAAASTHPGADGIAGTGDDVTGSPGVVLSRADGTYELEDYFGMLIQVTGRYAPSAINAGYSPTLFWDGRADGSFEDPVSGQVLLPAGAALESQAAGPPLSSAEMAHQNRDWVAVAERVAGTKPLALSPEIPADLETWIADRNYTALFAEAFGDDTVSAAGIIMAIATYERSLVSNQAPIDAFIAGNQNALTAQERLGQQLFVENGCAACHGGNRFTDDRFHYIGVRPQAEDLGRFNVTGNNPDRGRMRTPGLRNASLRGEFMHNGRFDSLADVVDFYDRGGDFDAPNKDNNIRPLNLTVAEKAALVAFLGRPLTDPRVASETGPFSRPALFSSSDRMPAMGNDSVAQQSGDFPQLVVVEPSLAGNPNLTLGLTGISPGAKTVLVIDDSPIPTGNGVPAGGDVTMRFELNAEGEAGENGYASHTIRIPGGSALSGKTIYGKWFVVEESTVAESASFSAPVFGESAGILPAPRSFSASDDTSKSRVALSWGAVTGALGYDLYRGTSSQFGDAVLIQPGLPGDTTSFTDTDVTPDTLFYYWIIAFDENEASSPGNVEIGSTYDLSGFELTAGDFLSDSEISLTWASHPGAASYDIYRGETSSPGTMSLLANTATNSHSDTSTYSAKTYYYRVVALDAGGLEMENSSVDAGGKSLGFPRNPSASDATFQDRIQVSWAPVTDATSYRVYRSTSPSSFALLTSTASTTWNDFSPSPGQTYLYRVEAANEFGNGAASSFDAGYRAVSAPTNVSAAVDRETGKVLISWTSAAGVLSYAVFRSRTNDFSTASEIGTTDGSEFSDGTAEEGVPYYYWVASIDESDQRVVEADSSTQGMSNLLAPDLLIGKSISSLRGDDIYNSNASGQTLVSRTRRLRTATIQVRSQNDGNTGDLLRYSGGSGNRFFRVYYYRSSPSAQNLTAATKVGTALSTPLEAGESENLLVKVKPVRSRQKNHKRTYRLTTLLQAISEEGTGQQDCVKIKSRSKY